VAAHQPAELLDGLADPFERGERGARVRQHGGARVSEPHGLGGAVQERLAQLALELADLRTHSRLADVHSFGGAREVRGLDDGDEVLELANVHKHRF